MQCELDAEARNELAFMAYGKWTECIDMLKIAKEMQFDKRVDGDKLSFELSKKECIRRAEENLAKAVRVKDQICKYSPLVVGQ